MTKEKLLDILKDNFLIFMAIEELFFGTVLIAMLILILDQLVRIRLTIK